MKRKAIALGLIVMLFSVYLLPLQSHAAPKWWDRFKEIVKADVAGAADGYLQTETIGGAIAGGIKGSIEAGSAAGIGGPSFQIEEKAFSVGDFHNMGLSYVYEKARISAYPIAQSSWRAMDRMILTFLWEYGLYDEDIATYIGAMAPSFEAMMKGIQEGLKTSAYPISDRFYENLLMAFEVLDQEADDPRTLIEGFSRTLMQSASRESGEVLSRAYMGADYGKIEITYQPQKSKESNNDILLAALLVDVANSSFDYWYQKVDGLSEDKDLESDWSLAGAGGFDEIPWSPQRKAVELTVDQKEAVVGIMPQSLDVAPFVLNGRTHLPFRFIGEALGAEIFWNPLERSVTYLLDDSRIVFFIDQNKAQVNGNPISIDSDPSVVPFIVNGRTVVPVRFISEALGFEVNWEPVLRRISIRQNPLYELPVREASNPIFE